MRTCLPSLALAGLTLTSLAACSGSSGSNAPGPVGMIPEAQLSANARQSFAISPDTTGPQHLYIVNTTANVIEQYVLPLTTPLTASSTIPIVKPTGSTLTSMTVDSVGNVLYVAVTNYANYPPPNQPVYRCHAGVCKSIGTIEGGSGITISNGELYATAGSSAGNGYDYSQIIGYEYKPGSTISGEYDPIYQDAGMDYQPTYTQLAVRGNYLAAVGSGSFSQVLVCTDPIGIPSCAVDTVPNPSTRLNGAVALSGTPKMFLGLWSGTNDLAEICSDPSAGFNTCKAFFKNVYAPDETSTAAMDNAGNFYNIASSYLYIAKVVSNPTPINIPYAYGPIAVGK